MRKVVIGSLIGLLALGSLSACSWLKEKTSPKKAPIKVEQPAKVGQKVEASDYSNADNWLSKPDEPTMATDVFLLYPTAYQQKNKTDAPISKITDPSMRAGAEVFLASQGSAFETSGNVYAPYYRQLDTTWLLSKNKEQQEEYANAVPKADALAAFDYYIKNNNNGRPFILVGHSQGAAMIKEILFDYFSIHPDVAQRMVAAYVLGQAVTKTELEQHPEVKFAENADDTGVVISYNTVAPDFSGKLPTSAEGALVINPLSWTREETEAPASENLGSYIRGDDGSYEKVMALADAKVDAQRGLLICSSADKEKYQMPKKVQDIFPEGSFHNKDISFYYYNLKKNAENRVAQYLAHHPQ